MQLKHLFIGAFATLAPVVQAQITVNPTTLATSQWPKISSDLDAYYNSLTTNTEQYPYWSVLATATGIPPEWTGSYLFNDEVSIINDILTGSPAWVQALPTDVQSYISSMAAAEASIVNKDTSAGGRVGRVVDRWVGGLLVAGVIGTVIGAVML